MAITIIVEDGTGVAGANSYIAEIEYDAFLTNHGLTDSRTGDAKLSGMINGYDYVNAQDAKFSGTRTGTTQTGSFPRSGSLIYGSLIASDDIVQNVKDGQAQYAYESSNSSLYNVGTGSRITKEKVDVLEVEYADTTSSNPQPIFQKADNYLKPLYANTGGPARAFRV